MNKGYIQVCKNEWCCVCFGRYAHRPVEDSVIADLISKLEKEQAKNARLEQIAARQNSQSEQPKDSKSTNISANENVKSNHTGLKPETLSNNDESISKQSSDENGSMKSRSKSSANSSEPMETESSEHVTTVNQSMDVDRTENTISDHIVTAGSKNLGQNSTEPRSQAEASRRGAEALRNMNIPGVEVITPDDFYDLTPREQQVLFILNCTKMCWILVLKIWVILILNVWIPNIIFYLLPWMRLLHIYLPLSVFMSLGFSLPHKKLMMVHVYQWCFPLNSSCVDNICQLHVSQFDQGFLHLCFGVINLWWFIIY